METEILEHLKRTEEKVDAIYVSVERTRKYFFWTMVITITVIVLPVIGLFFAVPQIVSTYSEIGDITGD